MRGVHQPVFNAKLLVQHLRRWRQTISGATPVADHKMLGRIVQRVVHAHYHRQIIILAGAEIMTRFAPPLVICTAAFHVR